MEENRRRIGILLTTSKVTARDDTWPQTPPARIVCDLLIATGAAAHTAPTHRTVPVCVPFWTTKIFRLLLSPVPAAVSQREPPLGAQSILKLFLSFASLRRVNNNNNYNIYSWQSLLPGESIRSAIQYCCYIRQTNISIDTYSTHIYIFIFVTQEIPSKTK